MLLCFHSKMAIVIQYDSLLTFQIAQEAIPYLHVLWTSKINCFNKQRNKKNMIFTNFFSILNLI